MALVIFNPQDFPVTAYYLVGSETRQKTIKPNTSVDLGDVQLHPSTQPLIDDGTLELGAPYAPVIRGLYRDRSTPLYYYGTWKSGVTLGEGYVVLHNATWWMTLNAHKTIAPPSGLNSDFQQFPNAGTELPAPVEDALINGTIGDSLIDTISQSKITNLVTDLAGKLSLTGGTLTGHLVLPTTPGAANAVRRDWAEGVFLAKTGGTVSGAVSWAGTPTNANHLTNKSYVDSVAGGLPLTGGTLTGPLYLPVGTPTGQMATSRTYNDTAYLKLAGGTITGPIVWSGTPSLDDHLVNKSFLDSTVQGGGYEITSPITYVAAPVDEEELVNKAYADAQNVAGKTITSPITWAGPPTSSGHLTPKSYVDGFLPLTGGTITGPVIWGGTPTLSSHLINKSFLDSTLAAGGFTVAAPISSTTAPTLADHLVTKAYADANVPDINAVAITDGTRIYAGSDTTAFLEVGDNANNAPGILRVHTSGFFASFDGTASTLTADRVYDFPDDSGRLVLGEGQGVTDPVLFRDAIEARKSSNLLTDLSGDSEASPVSGKDYLLSADSTFFINSDANTPGWYAEVRIVDSSSLEFGSVLSSGTATINGATQATAATTVNGQDLDVFATRFGIDYNDWDLNVTELADASAIVITTDSILKEVNVTCGATGNGGGQFTLGDIRDALFASYSELVFDIIGSEVATIVGFTATVVGAVGVTPIFNPGYGTATIARVGNESFMVTANELSPSTLPANPGAWLSLQTDSVLTALGVDKYADLAAADLVLDTGSIYYDEALSTLQAVIGTNSLNSVLSVLGIPSYADQSAANLAEDIGKIYYDEALTTLMTVTA